jgi:hypothetical protein
VCLKWLVTGQTVGGTKLYGENNLLSREEALRLYTEAGTWFTSEEGKKGTLQVGRYADLAVLSDDYFAVDADDIHRIESLLTVVDGKVVFGVKSFADVAPKPLPVSPDWSPVGVYGGYGAPGPLSKQACCLGERLGATAQPVGRDLWGALGCACWAF